MKQSMSILLAALSVFVQRQKRSAWTTTFAQQRNLGVCQNSAMGGANNGAVLGKARPTLGLQAAPRRNDVRRLSWVARYGRFACVRMGRQDIQRHLRR